MVRARSRVRRPGAVPQVLLAFSANLRRTALSLDVTRQLCEDGLLNQLLNLLR